MKSGLKKLIDILTRVIQIPLNIILCLLYFILVLPYFFIYRNSFDPHTDQPSFWIDPKPEKPSLENLRRQF